jgi:hypothetical protein
VVAHLRYISQVRGLAQTRCPRSLRRIISVSKRPGVGPACGWTARMLQVPNGAACVEDLPDAPVQLYELSSRRGIRPCRLKRSSARAVARANSASARWSRRRRGGLSCSYLPHGPAHTGLQPNELEARCAGGNVDDADAGIVPLTGTLQPVPSGCGGRRLEPKPRSSRRSISVDRRCWRCRASTCVRRRHGRQKSRLAV